MDEQILICVNSWWRDLVDYAINMDVDDFKDKLIMIFQDKSFSYSPKTDSWILL